MLKHNDRNLPQFTSSSQYLILPDVGYAVVRERPIHVKRVEEIVENNQRARGNHWIQSCQTIKRGRIQIAIDMDHELALRTV